MECITIIEKTGGTMSLGKVLIFGDSYSTFEGFIPEGYEVYYDTNESGGTDVKDVKDTWWNKLIVETGSELVLNNSWSGSTIGYTGYENADCSKTSSFIYRLEKLCENGFFAENKIDTVFVFGGTNDNWSDAPIGELKYEDWERSDLYFVLPAVCYFLSKLKEIVSGADIHVLINTELKDEISDGIEKACDYYDLHSIRFKEIDKVEGHPTVAGMEQIKTAILQNIN